MLSNRNQGDQNHQKVTAMRKPQRISVTISYAVFEKLVSQSIAEGRSLSNLASYILERSINETMVQDPDRKSI
jgi:hypothetical protein